MSSIDCYLICPMDRVHAVGLGLSDSCCICFEEFQCTTGRSNNIHGSSALPLTQTLDRPGIKCIDGSHFVCNKDFASYCDENVLPSFYILSRSSGCIPCPVRSCSRPQSPAGGHGFFDPLLAYYQLSITSERVAKRYLNILSSGIYEKDKKIRSICEKLRSALTLNCPLCSFAVDPSPDACSAIMCLVCSVSADGE